MDIYDVIMEEDLLSLKLLFNQYKKELNDLERNVGISKTMSKDEIESTKNSLKDRINNLEQALSN